MSFVGYVQSGNYPDADNLGADPTGTRFTTAATRPVVAIRPDQLGDPDLANATIDRWFDVGAFGAPPTGRFGTAPGARLNRRASTCGTSACTRDSG